MNYPKTFILLCFLFLTSCSANLEDYTDATPEFNLFEYFNGETEAWGMVQDYTKKQTGRFYVTIHGYIEDDTLILDEKFTYSDGKKDTRVWHIKQLDDRSYVGKADDIIGTAKGWASGNVFRWQYDFDLELEDGNIEVAFDDWLYRQDEDHIFNISYIKKYGVTVGKVTLFFAKK